MNKPPLDHAKFTRLLAMTESSSDNEALTAVRKAAALARSSGMTIVEAASDAGDADEMEELRIEARFQRQCAKEADHRAGEADRQVKALKARISTMEIELEAERKRRAEPAGPWSRAADSGSPGIIATECLKSTALNSWEVKFCESLARRSWVTQKQRDKLRDIVDKVRGHERV